MSARETSDKRPETSDRRPAGRLGVVGVLAQVSLICGVVVWITWLLVLILSKFPGDFDKSGDWITSCTLMFMGFVAAPLGVVVGVLAFAIAVMMKMRRRHLWRAATGAVFCLLFFMVGPDAMFSTFKMKEQAQTVVCMWEIKQLGIAAGIYNEDHEGHYPAPERWCDLLVGRWSDSMTDFEIDADSFLCRSGADGRCDYAMNPLCEPNSPGDVVLLFESDAGWNGNGGVELLSFEHHKFGGTAVANVLFNDMRIEHITAADVNDLNWGDGGGVEVDSK